MSRTGGSSYHGQWKRLVSDACELVGSILNSNNFK